MSVGDRLFLLTGICGWHFSFLLVRWIEFNVMRLNIHMWINKYVWWFACNLFYTEFGWRKGGHYAAGGGSGGKIGCTTIFWLPYGIFHHTNFIELFTRTYACGWLDFSLVYDDDWSISLFVNCFVDLMVIVRRYSAGTWLTAVV